MEKLHYYVPKSSLRLPVAHISGMECLYLVQEHDLMEFDPASDFLPRIGFFHPELELEADLSGTRAFISRVDERVPTGFVDGGVYDKDGYLFRRGVRTALFFGAYVDAEYNELSLAWVLSSVDLRQELTDFVMTHVCGTNFRRDQGEA